MLRSTEPLGLEVTGLEEPRSGLFSTRCQGGLLRVPDLDELGYEPTKSSGLLNPRRLAVSTESPW